MSDTPETDELCKRFMDSEGPAAAIAFSLKCAILERQRDELLEALKEIVRMTDEDTGTFRKRGGTYRGLVGIAARNAIERAK